MNAPALSLSADRGADLIRVVAELSVAAFPGQLNSVVLTGSLARDEGTWLHQGARTRLAGDAEFLLVFEERKPLPSPILTKRLCAAVEARLAEHGIDAHIDLSPVGPAYLRRQQPHIFAYELITHGKVLWGDTQILDLVPRFTPADIPLEDGYRTLLNRMTELLEALCEMEDGEPITDAVGYRAMKLSLDMATSFLLFNRLYEPSYRARAHRLREFQALSAPSPLPLSRFTDCVQVATQRKLGEVDGPAVPNRAGLWRLIQDCRMLWRWELQNLTGSNPGTPDSELMRQWIAGQKPVERVRGWASAARRYGALRSLAHLPRWSRRALTGSPRRLLYAAASELMFALPSILHAPGHEVGDESRWDRLCLNLPISHSPGSVPLADAWRRLGFAISWNYHRFLATTRS